MREAALAVAIMLFILAQAAGEEMPILTIEAGGHTAMVKEVIFTPDGARLISAGHDKVVRIWDAETGELRRTLRGQIGDGPEGKIYAAALSPDGETLAVGGYPYNWQNGHPFYLFNLGTGAVTKTLRGHTNVIHALAFSPDGKWLASGSGDDTVRLWDVSSGECAHTLKGHTDSVYGVAFSHDSRQVVSASYDKTLRLWKVGDGKLLREMTGHTAEVFCVAYSPDGQYIASGSYDHTIRLWDGKTGKFIKILGEHDGNVNTLSFSPDSRRLVSVDKGSHKKARVWRVPSGELLTTFDKHDNVVLASAFSPDGKTIATAGGNRKDIYIWDAETGEVKAHIVGTGNRVMSVGFSRDGREFAFGSTYKSKGYNDRGPLERRFELLNMTLLEDIPAGPGKWRRAVTEHAGLTLKREDELNLRIQRSGRTQTTIKLTQAYDEIRCYTFTPSGEIIIGSAYTLALYNTSGKQKRKFTGHTGEVWAVAVSPDGRYLISGSGDQTARLWNIRTGELLVSFFIGSDREWVAWTPAGYYKASSGGDSLIGWHVNKGAENAAEYYYAYQYRRKFYRPDVLERVLEEGSVADAAAAANEALPRAKQEVSVAQITRMKPPAVHIISPGDNTVTREAQVHVKASIVSETEVTDITISVNGRPAWKYRKTVMVVPKLEGDVVEQTVPLEAGRNVISVIARNENAVSQPAMVTITYSKPVVRKPCLYALIVGVSDYTDSNYDLRYAHKDAQAVWDVFKDQKGKLFSDVKAKVLLNSDATKDNILDGLDWLISEATQKDVGIVFISGHGVHDQRRNYYFLPHDGDGDRLRRTAVNWYEFQDTLSSIPSKAMLFVDTCHAAMAAGKTKGSAGMDITEIIADLAADESGVVVMASSTGREVSIELDELKHGAFTKALVEGLLGKADYNKDGAIYLTEIDDYVTKRVKELTKGKQHPTTQKPSTVRSFPLTLVK